MRMTLHSVIPGERRASGARPGIHELQWCDPINAGVHGFRLSLARKNGLARPE
jgi:hypothetical protein